MPVKCSCGKQANFNLPGETKSIWCAKCKPENAINIGTKKCSCGNIPVYNLPGEIKPIWCKECKPIEAINVINKKCKCGKRASYNFPEEITPKWCSKCKPFEAVDVRNIKCKCGKKPSFNLSGETKPIWCSSCKPENAIYILKKIKCECGKHRPSFNLSGETTPIWCAECKQQNAINVINNKCKCGKIPNFNLEGKKSGLWCKNCKPEEAIDVKNKKCECGKHQPIFNLPEEIKPIWCSECKPNKAINVKNKMCKNCHNIQISNRKYKGYCVRCFINLFPDEPVSRNYKVKEKHVFDAVIELLPKDIKIIRDKMVGGCSKRRPDLMIDIGSHWICAENDENSHKDYDTSCEHKRIMELYTDMANRPMILIRFNCDKYSGGQGLFKTCRKTGISLIRSKKEFDERISKFAELTNKYIISEPPEKAITIEYLYYD